MEDRKDLKYLGAVNRETRIVNTCIIIWYFEVRKLKQVYLF